MQIPGSRVNLAPSSGKSYALPAAYCQFSSLGPAWGPWQAVGEMQGEKPCRCLLHYSVHLPRGEGRTGSRRVSSLPPCSASVVVEKSLPYFAPEGRKLQPARGPFRGKLGFAIVQAERGCCFSKADCPHPPHCRAQGICFRNGRLQQMQHSTSFMKAKCMKQTHPSTDDAKCNCSCPGKGWRSYDGAGQRSKTNFPGPLASRVMNHPRAAVPLPWDCKAAELIFASVDRLLAMAACHVHVSFLLKLPHG